MAERESPKEIVGQTLGAIAVPTVVEPSYRCGAAQGDVRYVVGWDGRGPIRRFIDSHAGLRPSTRVGRTP